MWQDGLSQGTPSNGSSGKWSTFHHLEGTHAVHNNEVHHPRNSGLNTGLIYHKLFVTKIWNYKNNIK
jgi:hypothetical protein